MNTHPIPEWLHWARQLQAIAQTGLTYTQDQFDIDRYTHIRSIAAEIMSANLGVAAPALVDLFSRDTGYATPKVDVRAAVFQEGRILLVREREDGCWTLPGGWADVADSPSVAAVREVKEESGYDVVARKLLAVYDRDLHGHPPIPFHAYKVFFLCELTGGASQTSHETDAVDFFADGALPPLSLTRTTEDEIAHMFQHYRDPALPASFD
jgi:ADP-ribose pyrophosphatase YjhB (NUDIX family)